MFVGSCLNEVNCYPFLDWKAAVGEERCPVGVLSSLLFDDCISPSDILASFYCSRFPLWALKWPLALPDPLCVSFLASLFTPVGYLPYNPQPHLVHTKLSILFPLPSKINITSSPPAAYSVSYLWWLYGVYLYNDLRANIHLYGNTYHIYILGSGLPHPY